MIQACARANKIERAFEIRKLMEAEGIRLLQNCYLALIRACCLSTTEPKPKERAKTIFEEMKQKGLCPDFVDFEILYKNLKDL